MSNDQKQEVSEQLFTTTASDAPDGGTDNSASTSEDADNSSTDTEESQGSDAEEQKRKQVQHHLALALSDPNHLEELKQKQKWLAELVEQKLTATQKVNEADQEARLAKLAKQEAEKLFQQKQEEEKFESLRRQLDAANTTTSQREAVQKKFEELKSKGLSRYDALELAVETSRIDLSNEAVLRSRMALPEMRGTKVKESDPRAKVMRQRELSDEEVRELAKKRSRMYRGVADRSID